jgi:hypothetical protein
MTVVQNVSLRLVLTLSDDDGWETSVAQAFKTVFYTGNYFACFSSDAGQTFKKVSPFKLAKSVGHNFCCDQNVLYVPGANVFVWILLADDGPVSMCLATPNEIVDSKGLSWTVYDLSGRVFRRESALFDYPQISFGDSFLYLTFNVIGTADAIVCRFELPQLRQRQTLNFQYFVATGNSYLCPCQQSGSAGLFLTQNTTSQLRVFVWRENSNLIQIRDVNVSTIPTDDWEISLPNGAKWLEPGSKIDSSVVGAARRRGELWAAWSGARRVHDKRENTFPHPHIGIAIISVQSFSLVTERFLWNPEHAFAYPSLATNPSGEIALTFAWGGDRHYVQHGVGFLTGQQELWSTTNDQGRTGGGHYITAGMGFPEIDRFIAAGYNSPIDTSKAAGYRNDPRYVVFAR